MSVCVCIVVVVYWLLLLLFCFLFFCLLLWLLFWGEPAKPDVRHNVASRLFGNQTVR